MTDPLAYYAGAGMMTDPRGHAVLLDALSAGVPALCRVVQGLLVHIFWAERYGLALSDERKQEVQIRPVAHKLARILELDPRPLCEPRALERRLVGNCRDFSTMLCAFLRHQGISARARCGFGTYFHDAYLYVDHWVCEYWHSGERRWVMVDPQLDALQCDVLGIDFDPLDMPPGRFVIAGQGWQMCRAGGADPHSFGIFEFNGYAYIRGNVVRDLMALNKVEILPWDGWGMMLCEEMTPEEYALFDRVAALTMAGDEAFADVRAVYEAEPVFRVPADWPV